MRILLQVVKEASIKVDEKIVSQIGKGFLLFVGFNYSDNHQIIEKTLAKALSLRLFADQDGKMNLGINDVGGEILCVSQFTLYADIKKGRRPSFNLAANAEVSEPYYQFALEYIRNNGYQVKAGIFGTDMKVSLINDGPTTIIIDSEDL